MKTKQAMSLRSVYMSQSMWAGIDGIADKEDLSSNQVIRRIMGLWLCGQLTEEKDARPARTSKHAPIKNKNRQRRTMVGVNLQTANTQRDASHV